jgi:tRNA pseudouridine-54 N-methylase
MSKRVAELFSHHERRLAEVFTKSLRGWRGTPGLFEQFDAHNKIFAIGEAYSRLLYLEEQGAIRRIEKDVVYWTR